MAKLKGFLNQTNQTMRVLALSVLAFCTVTPLFSQEDCDVFNIQQLAADYLSFGVDTVILQLDGSYEVQLSNGTTASITLGCTDPAYLEYDATANMDDGSCTTLIVLGCTNSQYVEFDSSANQDDGSCIELNTGCFSPQLDGHLYSVTEIGDQCWFAENLRTTIYSDGSPIQEISGGFDWYILPNSPLPKARCVLDNIPANVLEYGRLYTAGTLNAASGVCPGDWHVATIEEWLELEDFLGATGFEGQEADALKSTSGWAWEGNGLDAFQFSAEPGGHRQSGGRYTDSHEVGFWWADQDVCLGCNLTTISLWYWGDFHVQSFGSRYAMSIRCVKD